MILKYYKKSIKLFIIYVIWLLSYNYYFGFNFKPQTYLEIFCDFLSYIQFGIVLGQFVYDRDVYIKNEFTKIEEVLLKILAIKESEKNG